MASAVLRIRRKRTADPQAALLLSFKRSRRDSAGESRELYRLAGTASESDVQGEIEKLARGSQLSSIAVADVDTDQLKVSEVQSMEIGDAPQSAKATEAVEEGGQSDPSNPLACLNDAVGEVGGAPPASAASDAPQQSSITCNGTPLIRVKSTAPDSDDFVYDLYVQHKSKSAVLPVVATSDYFANLVDMRFLNAQQELVFVDEEEEEESMPDDEDSNDENNWRNDYPDEEDEESDASDDDDALNERFHRFNVDEEDNYDQYGEDSDCD